MKLLLYCTKAKPYITRGTNGQTYPSCVISNGLQEWHLNGKIVAKCDYEVEKITTFKDYERLLQETCLNNQQLDDYLQGENGYAIHIKNLHIFDEPKELSDYYGLIPKKVNTLNGSCYINESIDKAPQNMMYAIDDNDNEYVLISIQPQWMCKILNGEKTIEVRKKVLKEML